MDSQKYAIVDLETTGHSPMNGDRMIQIAIVIMNDWTVEKKFTTFIHPGKSIPLYIQDLTNITDDDVKDALPFEDHAHTIYELLQDATFVAHNADFDLSFLQAEFERAGLPKWRGNKIDTVELAKILFPMSLSYKLGDLAYDLNIPLNNAHRADDDALACALVLKKCWEELLNLPQLTLEQLHKHSFRLKSNLSHLFFNALQIKRTTVNEPSNIVYLNNLALRNKNSKLNSKVDLKTNYPSKDEEKVSLFKNALPNYEQRPEQFKMMDLIWNQLNQKSEMVIEASTGIGKTIGYLLPSIIYAKQTNSKVCISTYTSHLLEQLLMNEIPKIEKMLGSKVHTVLLKGMHHYIDIQRFIQITQIKSLSYDETLTMLQVLVWLTKTESGDMEELNVSGGGKLFLNKIRKGPDSINNQNSSFDFYNNALLESENADIVITNHSMLIADLNRKVPIFQNVSGYIIDEAHQFIQAAEIRDEAILTYTNWKYTFGQIGLSNDDQLFTMLKQLANKHKNVSLRALYQLETVFNQIVELFDQLMERIVKNFKHAPKNKFETKQVAFIKNLLDEKDPIAKELPNKIQQWVDLAERVISQIENDVEQLEAQYVSIVEQWKYWIREYKIKAHELDEIFLNQSDLFSTWVEIDQRNVPGSIRIYKKPIDVKDTVHRLFNDVRNNSSIIWTSGTMTVPNNKRYIADQLGISKETEVHSFIAKENYYRGAKGFIVTDMPDIQGVSQNEYVESVALAVTRTVRATDGRSFVLFTSQEMLKKTVELIQESELLQEYMLFAQGVTPGSRMRLLKSFQKFNRSVLFGTNSFWEGVDVPGDSLSAVIIVRLPFTAPEEPTFKAKSLKLTQQGRNAFNELSLPDAIIRFKQGFGRLIRTSTDKGVFIVLDRRIETKSYGKEFIQALPPISIQKLPLQDMVLELEHWYNS
ncbi:ATP-dependent DNA helicase DinG [Ureibacillus acetophenoni]|uniref:3'-5' exonuclease DinG n=1 Tax=Ureibacillus acetophenoni TaxID=614649 RepID=A0A285U8D3_9BACL|nr:ATP-dependent DNA helicase DinG [Ureibacillus acetophenoni]SOC37638.1 ATP-dependent DNA helicase DinG [Ureibacillus acetophenoni]